jgi:hypothetical protein
LDPNIILDTEDYKGVGNTEPLLVNLKDTWRLRPEAVTAIPNLFLASDYVRTYTDLATMEGANEAARRAVNGILAASGSNAIPCSLWKLHELEIFQPLRDYDRTRWKAGLPWDDRWVSVALSLLELVQKAAGISSGNIGYVSSAAGSVGPTIDGRAVDNRGGSTDEQMLLRVSKQILSLVENAPAEAVTRSDAHERQRGAEGKNTARESSISTATVPLPRRSRIRIVQKQS